MKQMQEGMKVFDSLAEIEAEVRRRLERTLIYRRFVFERARLEKMAAAEVEKTGVLSNQAIIAQNNVVQTLGEQVLQEIDLIRFMLDEPSHEEFLAARHEKE